MAQSTNFFGIRQGSTKSLTFSIYRGKQITKDRVTHVANPQTSGQMQQRLKLPLVANAASILKNLINHSFEGIDYGWKSVQEFRRLNLDKGALAIASYVPKSAATCGVADFIVSKGTLTPFAAKKADVNESGVNYNPLFICNFGNSALYEGTEKPAADSAVTADQITFIKSMLESAYMDLDQITIVMGTKTGVSNTTDSDGNIIATPVITFSVSRLVLDTDRIDENSGWKWDSQGLLKNDVMRLQVVENELVAYTTITATGEDLRMGTVIGSKEVSSAWKRTSQRMVVFEANDGIPYDVALPTYLKNAPESQKYLNTGTEGIGVLGSPYATNS